MGRVRQHLAYMPRDGTANQCYAALVARGVHLDPQIAEIPRDKPTIPSSAKGINRLDATQASGPLQPPPVQELKEAKFRWTLLTQKARRKHLHIPVRELQERDEWKALTQCTIEWCVMVHDAPGERSNADEAYDLQEAWQKALCGALHHDELNEALFYRWGQRELSELQVLYSDGWTEMSLEQAYLEIVEAMGLPQLQDE